MIKLDKLKAFLVLLRDLATAALLGLAAVETFQNTVA